MSFVCIDVWIKSLSWWLYAHNTHDENVDEMLISFSRYTVPMYGKKINFAHVYKWTTLRMFLHFFLCVILCILKCSFLLVVVCAFLFFYIVIIMISCHVCVYVCFHTHTQTCLLHLPDIVPEFREFIKTILFEQNHLFSFLFFCVISVEAD